MQPFRMFNCDANKADSNSNYVDGDDGGGGGGDEDKQCNAASNINTYCTRMQSNIHLNRALMDAFKQYAICGMSSLLVKHHNKRAGLNHRSQICLL